MRRSASERRSAAASRSGERRRLLTWLFVSGGLAAACGAGGALGAVRAADERAKGTPLGAFRLFSEWDVHSGLDDNVFKEAVDAREDLYGEAGASFRLASEWVRHDLQLTADLRSRWYDDYSNEDSTNWLVAAKGRLDVRRSFKMLGEVSSAQMHEDRASPNAAANTKYPTEFSVFHARGDAVLQPNRLGFSVTGLINRYDFTDNELLSGVLVDNRYRDHDHTRLSSKFFYDFSPGYTGFVTAAYDRRAYDVSAGGGGNRNSRGYFAGGGLSLKLAALLQGELSLGYLSHDFSGTFEDFSGLSYGGSLEWEATPRATVRLDASRELHVTTIADVSAVDDQELGASLSVEILRNLTARADISYLNSAYVGTDRTDQTHEVGAALVYFVGHQLSATTQYLHRERSSPVATQNYVENKIDVSVQIGF